MVDEFRPGVLAAMQGDIAPSELPEAPLLKEIGVTGLKRTGGIIYEEELLHLRQRQRQYYNTMADDDPVVGGMLYLMIELALQPTWVLQPARGGLEAQLACDFLREVLFEDLNTTFRDVLAGVLRGLFVHGYSLHELVYKRRDGEEHTPASKFADGWLGLHKLPVRAQETIWRWEFDPHDEVVGAWQRDPNLGGEYYLPRERTVLFRTTTYRDNPEGRSLLRNAFRPWYFKKHIEDMEAIGAERELAGIPVAWVPPQLLQASRTAEQTTSYNYFKDLVLNMRRDDQAGLILPLAYTPTGQKVYDFELLRSGGNYAMGANTGPIIERKNREMALSVMADVILIGHERVGSYALMSSKTELFSLGIQSLLRRVADAFEAQVYRPLLKLNGVSTRLAPHTELGDIELSDASEVYTAINAMLAAREPLDDLGPLIRQRLGFPPRPPGASPPPDSPSLLEAPGSPLQDLRLPSDPNRALQRRSRRSPRTEPPLGATPALASPQAPPAASTTAGPLAAASATPATQPGSAAAAAGSMPPPDASQRSML